MARHLERCYGDSHVWPPSSASYVYDAHGNRLNGGGSTYVYQPGTFRLIEQNGLTFSYDANGNLKTGPNASYDYTPENLLSAATVVGQTTTYDYDADGARARKVSPAGTSYFLRGAGGELLTESQDPGTASSKTRDYIYAGSRLISVVEVTGNAP